MRKSKSLCHDCRDDFYNDHNPLGVKECWCFKGAEVVTRYRLGWWTQPTQPGAFTKVTTLSCHYAPGKYAHYKELPDCARKARKATVSNRPRLLDICVVFAIGALGYAALVLG